MEDENKDIAGSIRPEDARSPQNSINYLLVRQLDRLDYLLTLGLSRSDNPTDNIRRVYYPLLFGLYSLEKLLSNDLSEDYKTKTEILKDELKTNKFNEDSFYQCMLWYETIIKELPSIMLPKKSKTLDFEE